jgi:ribosomal protein L7Ae-like RNA K-turn-binding protein
MSLGNRRSDLLRILGLAYRAGSVVVGTAAVRRALRADEAYLVLTARDASPVQLDKIEGLLRARGIPRIIPGTRAQLGAALGSPPLTAAAVTQRGWAARLRTESPADAGPE